MDSRNCWPTAGTWDSNINGASYIFTTHEDDFKDKVAALLLIALEEGS
jgi:hypothetical protein